MNGFNIQARIENQNITYFYPGRSVGKRGRNLSPQLDKPGLEEKFKQNRELIHSSLDIQRTLSEWRTQILSTNRTPLPHLGSQRPEQITQPTQNGFDYSVIPLEEIHKAKTSSILDYCRKEKIEVSQNEVGKAVLKNREYVEVSEYSWINLRNKTQGTLIDFVANHRSTNFLQAVSIINNNPNLMLLEKYMGESHRPYRTFHIPKGESATRSAAIVQLGIFLGQTGQKHNYASLFRSQSVQVTKDLKIRFFPRKDSTGYLEYIPDAEGKFQKKVYGTIRSPYFNQKGKGEELEIFLEPRTLLAELPEAFDSESMSNVGRLALLEPNLKLVHQVLASQKAVKKVRVFQNASVPGEPGVSQFFEELKATLDPFSIDTSLAWEAVSGLLPSQARSLDYQHSTDLFSL